MSNPIDLGLSATIKRETASLGVLQYGHLLIRTQRGVSSVDCQATAPRNYVCTMAWMLRTSTQSVTVLGNTKEPQGALQLDKYRLEKPMPVNTGNTDRVYSADGLQSFWPFVVHHTYKSACSCQSKRST